MGKMHLLKTVTSIVFFIGILSTGFAQNPLFIPPVDEGPVFQLTEAPSSKEFMPGVQTPTYGINGNYLAPTLIFNKEEWVQLNVTNNLSELSTMHWHGMHIPAETDGGPLTPIQPGETWTVAYQVLNLAGTYWYHPHPHGQTTAQVNMGLAGMIIVRDDVEAALELPRTYGVDDLPLIIQDKAFDVDGALVATGFGDTMMVNGTLDPAANVPAQVVRFRALNASNARSYYIGLNDNRNFYQIGSDDGLLENPVELNRILLSPGERVEFLIDFSQDEGDTLQLMSYSSEMPVGVTGADVVMGVPGGDSPLNGTIFPFLKLCVGVPTADPVVSVPATLVAPYLVPDESDADVVRTITMTSSAPGPGGPVFLLDETPYDMAVINQTVNLGDTEIWEIVNESILAHPFHIHDEEFFILDRNGVPPPENERGPKDVVLVLPDETVRFIITFEDYADSDITYMYHCHILPHEDGGMMGQFLVLDIQTTAGFSALNNVVCVGEEVEFNNASNQSDEWLWEFGDGMSSTESDPVHVYQDPGEYDVILVAINTGTGISDTLTMENFILVNPTVMVTNEVEINEGDSLFVGGAWQTELGTYVDSLLTSEGCDHIIVTNLSVITSALTLSFDGRQIVVSPNPNNGYFSVNMTEWNGEAVRIRLLHPSGKVLTDRKIIGNHGDFLSSFAMPELATGIYFLEVQVDNQRGVLKMVKN